MKEDLKKTDDLKKTIKEISDYKYALDESAIVDITDQNGVITHVNDNFCKISKYTSEELIGKDHRIVNSGHHSKEFFKELWETILNKKVWKGELKNITKDGSVYWVDTTIVPFLNIEGKPYQFLSIGTDITEKKKAEEELQKTIKEISDYKYALDESAIIDITNQNGIITHINDNFCKISKYSCEELIGKNHKAVNSGHHSKEFIKELWETISNKKVWKGEIKNIDKDGSFYWVDTTIVPFLNEYGRPYQYISIGSDITERKKAEEELQKTIREISDYKYALEESAIIAITDQRGVISHVNDNFCKISKYSREELIGKDHRIINSGHHSKDFIKELWGTIAKGKVWKGELKNEAKDGSAYWVDTTIVPFLNEYGKPYQYVAIRSDISERKKNEEQLEKTIKEISDYKHALDESAIIAITDQRGFITHVNDNFCKISKYSREDLIGQDHRIINSGHHSKEFIKELWVTIAKGNIWKGELKNKAKDGSFYWVDTTIIPFLNEYGKPYQYVAIRSDITKRKKGEEELNRYANTLQIANTQLVDFTNIVSHNLRGPLTNISAFLEFLKETDDKNEQKELIENMTKTINHLNLVFEELIETVQIKHDTEIKLDEIVLKEAMNKTLIGFEIQIKLLKAVIQIDFDEAPVIKYSHKYLDSLLLNLISNAFKYRSPKRAPIVKIKTEVKNGNIILSVSDNGLGIDLEKHKDSLFKIRKTFHDHPEAKGFGLFMTKSQIEAMGGNIWAESKVDEGTTFFVEIKK
ncbi:PAS domain-containing sensor histidine kinase [Flavobacterium granuli]|uniref:histidine kinase n=1 Tax=Flavobacterium granuli TaxID=280093 RepID=A0ABU1RXK2_9FLAO|nr:PAS domain-containing sensor histidine kinase [Flavobacterium granuli]MDR6843491.1 PAS domain S-box-containing protein [Flavobacterium granuli]